MKHFLNHLNKKNVIYRNKYARLRIPIPDNVRGCLLNNKIPDTQIPILRPSVAWHTWAVGWGFGTVAHTPTLLLQDARVSVPGAWLWPLWPASASWAAAPGNCSVSGADMESGGRMTVCLVIDAKCGGGGGNFINSRFPRWSEKEGQDLHNPIA